jgi:hypothetical protein
MNMGMCKPCADRGRKRPASKDVAGTLMCEPCFTGKDPVFYAELLDDSQLPLGTLADLVVGELRRLKAAPPGKSLKLTLTGFNTVRVQKYFFRYASEVGVEIKTDVVDKILYVRRVVGARSRLVTDAGAKAAPGVAPATSAAPPRSPSAGAKQK